MSADHEDHADADSLAPILSSLSLHITWDPHIRQRKEDDVQQAYSRFVSCAECH